jgi:hypothetical protein
MENNIQYRKPPVGGQQTKGWSLEKKLNLGDHKVEDLVNHPAHYNAADIECIDAIRAATDEGFEYYLQGNIMKYLWRYRYKNGIQDLEKAQWYLTKLIETWHVLHVRKRTTTQEDTDDASKS